jgi:hypothetical protein
MTVTSLQEAMALHDANWTARRAQICALANVRGRDLFNALGRPVAKLEVLKYLYELGLVTDRDLWKPNGERIGLTWLGTRRFLDESEWVETDQRTKVEWKHRNINRTEKLCWAPRDSYTVSVSGVAEALRRGDVLVFRIRE